MCRKWKSVFALGLAMLIGCLMPMDTILAAEEEPEAAQMISEDSVSGDEAILDDENFSDEVNEEDNEDIEDEVYEKNDDEIGDEEYTDDDNASAEAYVEDVNADDEVQADNEGIAVMSETEGAEAGGVEAPASVTEPVINITWQGQGCTYSLDDEIEYKYVNNRDQAIACSVSQGSFYYYLDKGTGATIKAKGIGDISSWTEVSSSSESIPFEKDEDAIYVLYVKAEADGQTIYARSGGIVVDTKAPAVSPLVEGGTYAEGTAFWVSDPNLDLESVTVNEKPVTPASDKSYQVSANGTSCVIKAKDKAGNEMTCSITVSGKDLEANGIISASGIYSLKAGTSYQLAAGKWQVGGDKSVYLGSSTFYVKTSGDYTFTKR